MIDLKNFVDGVYVVGGDIEVGSYILEPIDENGGEFIYYDTYNDFVSGSETLNEDIVEKFHFPLRKENSIIKVSNLKIEKQ